MDKFYILDEMEASNVSYDHTYTVFRTLEEAKEKMSQFIKQKMEEYEYTEDDIAECEEINSESYDYFEGLDDEWAVRIETADKGWED